MDVLPRMAFSVRDFCTTHGLSQSFFYKLQNLGQGPQVFRFGRRTFVSVEAAAVWRGESHVPDSGAGPDPSLTTAGSKLSRVGR